MPNGLAKLFSCVLVMAPALSHAVDVQYDLTTIPLSGDVWANQVYASDLNNNGVVLGTLHHTGEDVYSTFTFDSRNGTLVRSEYRYIDTTWATAINDHGMIVGTHRSESTTTEAWIQPSVRLPSMQLEPLSYPHRLWFSRPTAINNSNQVVGGSHTLNNWEHAVLWNSPDDVQDLGTLGGYSSVAHGINDQGMVTGTSGVAFLYANGQMQALNGLEETSSTGYAINEAGDIVGEAGNDFWSRRAFLYRDGVTTLIDVPLASSSTANDINESGWMVGTATLAGGTTRFGFLYADGEVIDLATLVPAGWTVRQATDIADSGQILAELCQGTTCTWGLLTPVPEPATWGMLAAGLTALAIVARQRRGGYSAWACGAAAASGSSSCCPSWSGCAASSGAAVGAGMPSASRIAW